MIFVNSMSDLFHEDVPFEFIEAVFDTMRRAEWHVFQVLTKRAERLAELSPRLSWPPNVWMGVSVENQWWTRRIRSLTTVPAAVRFLSCEPLLGPLALDLQGIGWVIVGGESGPKARPMEPEWVYRIKEQCAKARTPLFVKQLGKVWARQTGSVSSKGSNVTDWPTGLRVRSLPAIPASGLQASM
jgi:protein gp37